MRWRLKPRERRSWSEIVYVLADERICIFFGLGLVCCVVVGGF